MEPKMAEVRWTSLTLKTFQTQVWNLGSFEWLEDVIVGLDIDHINNMLNPIFFIFYSLESVHPEDSHNTLNDTNTEDVTEAPVKLLAGINCFTVNTFWGQEAWQTSELFFN